MKQTSGPAKKPADTAVKNIRRATRTHYSAKDKIPVVLEGLRGEESIAELSRPQITVAARKSAPNLFHRDLL